VEMVNNLADALGTDIKGLEWMDPATRKAAIAKLNAFTRKIGYPDKWRDYTKLTVDRGSLCAEHAPLAHVRAASRHR